MVSSSRAGGSSSSKSGMELLRRAFIYGILATGAIVVLIPFAWTVSTALKEPDDIFKFPVQWLPDPVAWENFPKALTSYPFDLWARNTVFIVLISTLGILISCSLSAFAFARLRWPGRDYCFLLLLATMMLPSQVTMIPTFILFRQLGWVNTFKPLVIPPWFARNTFYIFLMRQFFLSIPLEMDDAARIDGAGYFQTYARIILPMSKSVLAISAIMFAQFKWKEFMAPLIFLHDSDKFTIALGVRAFQGQYGTDWNYMMAVNLVFMIPLIVVFYFAQRYFIQGIVVTGIKG